MSLPDQIMHTIISVSTTKRNENNPYYETVIYHPYYNGGAAIIVGEFEDIEHARDTHDYWATKIATGLKDLVVFSVHNEKFPLNTSK